MDTWRIVLIALIVLAAGGLLLWLLWRWLIVAAGMTIEELDEGGEG